MTDVQAVVTWLNEVEAEMAAQTEACMEKGWDSGAGLFWDKRCVQRATLRKVLGLPEKLFNEADTMAGW